MMAQLDAIRVWRAAETPQCVAFLINEAGDRIGDQREKCTYNGKQDRRQKRPMGRLGGGAFDGGSKL